MARVLNLIIVIMEVIGFSKSLKGRSVKEHLIYYTQISNLLTFLSSILITQNTAESSCQTKAVFRQGTSG